MVDFPSFLPAGLPADPALLPALLDLLPMGVIYYTPVLDAAGTLTDLALSYLNPAAQRMTGLPAQPGVTYRQQFPTTDDNGAWDFHRGSWLQEEPQQFQFYYDADGFDSYFRVVARRLGEGLLVVFTDTQNERRSEMEQALRASQAREQERTRELATAQAATERERALLQALLTQAPVAIALFQGEEMRVAAATAEMAAVWGHPLAEVVGQPLLQGVPELQGQGFDELLQQVLRTQVPVTGTEAPAKLLRAGQLQTSYYNFIYQPLYDAEGQVLGVIDVAVEVTEQVLARRQLEQLNQELEARVQQRTQEALALQAELLATAQRQVQARESFYQVFEQTPAAVSLLRGPQYRFEYVNPVHQQVFAGRQLLGRNFAEALPDAATQGFLALLDGVYRTGETYFGDEVPFVSEQPDAPSYTTYFTFTYQAYRENGEIAGISTFALDVTEQVLARREREIQRQLLATVFAQAPVALFVLRGADYVFDIVNDSMGRMLDMDPAYMLGKRYFDLLPALEAQGYRQLLDQVWHTGQEYVAQEQAARLPHHQEGETGYYTFTYVPLREADGSISGIMCVAVDVTAQVLNRQQVQQLNDELQTSNTQLTRTNVDLDNFIYTASHDLKAPITNIEGLLLALEHELPAAGRTGDVPLMLTMMQDAIERFQRTLGHLTDLSRLQKEHNPDADAVALAPVVEAVRLDLTPLLTHTQGQLTVSISDHLTVTFAEKNLRSVVYNLLSNAFKYRHPDRLPEVQLRASLTDDCVVLEVQDNGLGLDLARGQEQLFGMFQRLHTHVEGTGIGLYMVRKIVENAGGRIEVHSELGQGSTFRVFFRR